jgi:hypothetical protein
LSEKKGKKNVNVKAPAGKMHSKGNPGKAAKQDEFVPERDGVKELDELCMRIQVLPLQNPQEYNGLALISTTGRAYSLVDIFKNMVELMSQVVIHTTSLATNIEQNMAQVKAKEMVKGGSVPPKEEE